MEYSSRRVESRCLQVISVLNYIINVFDDFKFWLGLVILIYLIIALVLRGRRPKTPIWVLWGSGFIGLDVV
jgi:hypothetical protein